MKINKTGKVILNDNDIFELIYQDKFSYEYDAEESKGIALFNKYAYIFDYSDTININEQEDVDIEMFDKERQSKWFVPEDYLNMNIDQYLLDKCRSEEEQIRVVEELKLFKQHNMMTVLKALLYLIDTMKENNIVWGIGRGSSCASYCLYLIGLHKVNSIKYDLPIDEFLH